jgi:hypothetical protein
VVLILDPKKRALFSPNEVIWKQANALECVKLGESADHRRPAFQNSNDADLLGRRHISGLFGGLRELRASEKGARDDALEHDVTPHAHARTGRE